jgi:hypothetical protein
MRVHLQTAESNLKAVTGSFNRELATTAQTNLEVLE